MPTRGSSPNAWPARAARDRSGDGADQHRDLPPAGGVARRRDRSCAVRRKQGVLVSAFAARTVRAVTHLDVDAAQCRQAADVLAKAVET